MTSMRRHNFPLRGGRLGATDSLDLRDYQYLRDNSCNLKRGTRSEIKLLHFVFVMLNLHSAIAMYLACNNNNLAVGTAGRAIITK